VTTVGFGDIVPKTDLGRFVSSVMMLIGWGTLAVPTGIVTAEMTVRRHGLHPAQRRTCTQCGADDHLPQSAFCQHCGCALPPPG
jgi:voltage-gated potassium channel